MTAFARRAAPAVTGERVSTARAGFGPTFQRHVAAYTLCASFLPQGRVLDLGCGTGHSYQLLAPRETVGVDAEPSALAGQDRPTVVADMRDLPLPSASFDGVLASHSIEHVPDPEAVLEEIVRVLRSGATAVLVTPNRLTFARADEVIDPYHFIEYDPSELTALCAPHFAAVELYGLFGSERYRALQSAEKRKLDLVLRLDPLGARHLVPRRLRQRGYDLALRRARGRSSAAAEAITAADFTLGSERLESAADLIAVCRRGPS